MWYRRRWREERERQLREKWNERGGRGESGRWEEMWQRRECGQEKRKRGVAGDRQVEGEKDREAREEEIKCMDYLSKKKYLHFALESNPLK